MYQLIPSVSQFRDFGVASIRVIPLKNPRSRRQGLTIRTGCGLGRQNDFQFSRSAQKKASQAVEEVSEG